MPILRTAVSHPSLALISYYFCLNLRYLVHLASLYRRRKQARKREKMEINAKIIVRSRSFLFAV